MLPEIDKYKVEILKIIGFALLTPIAKVILEAVAILKKFGLLGYLTYLIVCIGLGTLGVRFVLRGCDILDLIKRK